MIFNPEIKDKKYELYKNSLIISWKTIYTWFDFYKNKQTSETVIYCHIYRKASVNQPLNLGQCNNGSNFMSVNHSINQAKSFIDFFTNIN